MGLMLPCAIGLEKIHSHMPKSRHLFGSPDNNKLTQPHNVFQNQTCSVFLWIESLFLNLGKVCITELMPKLHPHISPLLSWNKKPYSISSTISWRLELRTRLQKVTTLMPRRIIHESFLTLEENETWLICSKWNFLFWSNHHQAKGQNQANKIFKLSSLVVVNALIFLWLAIDFTITITSNKSPFKKKKKHPTNPITREASISKNSEH